MRSQQINDQPNQAIIPSSPDSRGRHLRNLNETGRDHSQSGLAVDDQLHQMSIQQNNQDPLEAGLQMAQVPGNMPRGNSAIIMVQDQSQNRADELDESELQEKADRGSNGLSADAVDMWSSKDHEQDAQSHTAQQQDLSNQYLANNLAVSSRGRRAPQSTLLYHKYKMDGQQSSGQPFMQDNQWKQIDHRIPGHMMSPDVNDAAESLNMQYNNKTFERADFDGENEFYNQQQMMMSSYMYDNQDSLNPFGSPLQNQNHALSYNDNSQAVNEAMMMPGASGWQNNGPSSHFGYDAPQQPTHMAYYPGESRQQNIAQNPPKGYSFSQSSSESDGENRGERSYRANKRRGSKHTHQLNFKQPACQENMKNDMVLGMSDQHRIKADFSNGNLNENQSRQQYAASKNSGLETSEHFIKKPDQIEKPDEFHQMQLRECTSRVSDEHDANFDGYNDYGANNFSRTDKKLTKGIIKKNSLKNGRSSKASGDKLMEPQMYKTQQVWPSQAIDEPLFQKTKLVQNQKDLDNFPDLDLHQLPNLASQEQQNHYYNNQGSSLNNLQSPQINLSSGSVAKGSKQIIARQRLATKRNTMSFGIQSTRSELIKKMPISSKSPTGISRQNQLRNEITGDEIIERNNNYVEIIRERKQAKTVMGFEGGPVSTPTTTQRKSDAFLIQKQSSHYSLSNSNKQLKQVNKPLYGKYTVSDTCNDNMVAKLKSKCTTMSGVRVGGVTLQPSPNPMIEQQKKGSLNKMKTLSNTIKHKSSPFRANSKLDSSHSDTNRTIQAAPSSTANYKTYYYTHSSGTHQKQAQNRAPYQNAVSQKCSPIPRSSPQSMSPPGGLMTATDLTHQRADISGRLSDAQKQKPSGLEQSQMAQIKRLTDQDKNNKISPYKLIMFGHKDMYYKKESRTAKISKKAQIAPGRESGGHKNKNGQSQTQSNLILPTSMMNVNTSRDQAKRESKTFKEIEDKCEAENIVIPQNHQDYNHHPEFDHIDDFMKFDQENDFQVGEGLNNRQNGSRNAQVYEINQLNGNGVVNTDEKINDCQFVTQPRNMFDTESNARTESKDGSGIKSRPQIKNSELNRISSQENTQEFIQMEPDREFRLIAWEETNEKYNNQYQNYRPKTQRYYQSVESNFHIISEQDEAFEGQLMKRSDDTVSEKNLVCKAPSMSNAGGIQNTPESVLREENIDHRMEVKKYVDSFLEHNNDCSGATSSQNVNLLSSKMISNNNCPTYHDALAYQQDLALKDQVDSCRNQSPCDQEQSMSAKKTRNMNQCITVKKAYNISKEHAGSTNEIITNGDNDQVLITLNSKHLNSGHLTMQSSIKHQSIPQSKTNSVPQSQVVSRKPSHSDMHVSQNQVSGNTLPFESPKEVHKIVFSNNIKMGALEPSCIEEFAESKEQTKLHSAEPELISEHERSPRILSRAKKSDESSGGGTVGNSQQNKSQLFGKETEIRESLCSIPEEYPSQNEDAYNESQQYGQKIALSIEQEGEDDANQQESKSTSFKAHDDQGQQQVFVSDHLLKPLNQNDEYGKCLDEMHINMKYPTPEDRELVLPTKSTTAQKSKSEINNAGIESAVTCSFKMDTDKQQMLSFTENKDTKQPKTSPQPRKLAKQTSLKTFHTFDPEGNKMRFQNLSKSADSNFSNIDSHQNLATAAINLNEQQNSSMKYLNDIMQDGRDDQQQYQSGSIDEIPGENSVGEGQQQQTEEIRIMTQEEYFQMKKEQLEDIYLGTEIIYEEDMENHEFSTLQTCQSAQRLILPNQFNNMNFEGNTTQSLSPKKRSSKGMMSPDSRKSWQITNSLEKQAVGPTNTSQKFDSNTLKDSLGNSNAAKRINNLRKKYSIDAQLDIGVQGKLEGSMAQKLPSYLKLQKPTLVTNQPIVALNQNSQQQVLPNGIGAFVPSTNFKRKTQPQMQSQNMSKNAKLQPSPPVCEPSKRPESSPLGPQISQKHKQRSISPLNILMVPQSMQSSTPSNHHQQQLQYLTTSYSSPQQHHPAKSARSPSKAFQNQFKPKARNTSVSKQSISPVPGATPMTHGPSMSKSPHQRPYTSNGVIKHGVNTRPSMTAREKSPSGMPVTPSVQPQIPINLSPNGSKKNVNSRSNQQLKKGEVVVLQQNLADVKSEMLVDQIYYNQTGSLSQLQQYQNMQNHKQATQKHKKQQTQHEAYSAILDSAIPSTKIINQKQMKSGHSEQHQLSWKKFLEHKKSQQHTQSHLLLNSSSSKIDNSHISQNQPNSLHLEKMNSQKLCNANRGEIKTGQINLMDSENGSVKSLDKVHEKHNGAAARRGRSEGKYSQKDQQAKSVYNRLSSDIHDETLVAGSGVSLADKGIDDISGEKEGNLPRMASYSTHNQGSVKVATATSPPNVVNPAIYNSPPKLNTPNQNEPQIVPQGQQPLQSQQNYNSVEITQTNPKKPLVPKLKLSKVQLHRGVPKPLLTPQSGPKQKQSGPSFSLKQVVTQKQATARNNQLSERLPQGFQMPTENQADYKKKLMIQQQLSLPHVQANKKNMMKAAARERKWVQGTMLKKPDKRRQVRPNGVNATTIVVEPSSSACGLANEMGARPSNSNNLVSFGVAANQTMASPGNRTNGTSGYKTKPCPKRQVVIDLQGDYESPSNAANSQQFSKRLSIPVKTSSKIIDVTLDHNHGNASKLSSSPISSQNCPVMDQDQDSLQQITQNNKQKHQNTDKAIKKRKNDPRILVIEQDDQEQQPQQVTKIKKTSRKIEDLADKTSQIEQKSTGPEQRKISTADEFKKNHIMKASPLQQIKFMGKNLADIGELLLSSSRQPIFGSKNGSVAPKGSTDDGVPRGSPPRPSQFQAVVRQGPSEWSAHSQNKQQHLHADLATLPHHRQYPQSGQPSNELPVVPMTGGPHELIILSTNSEQRVHSRQSYISPNKKNSTSI